MRKIVINSDYGGFGLSDQAWGAYCERTGKDVEKDYYSDIPRDDATLVELVESMGKKANGMCASLKVVEIPDDVQWRIQEYDGAEWVAEIHRTWS